MTAIYITIGAITWVAALYAIVRLMGHEEGPDRWFTYGLGSIAGALAAAVWPIVVIALAPVAIVRYLTTVHRKDRP